MESELLSAAGAGRLSRVQWLLSVEGGASITERSLLGRTALLRAAHSGRLPTVQWLLSPEGGATIAEADSRGHTALLLATDFGRLPTVQWLLEHGGADTGEPNARGQAVWGNLRGYLIEPDEDEEENNAAAVTALLRVMVLRGAPPAELAARLSPEHARVVEEGARLRALLPAYLARRRALLDAHCPLIAPLRALVRGYDPEPTTTEELWATGLGAAP